MTLCLRYGSVLLLMAVFLPLVAAAPAINWSSPADGSYQYTNFTITVSTDTLANCTYNITGGGGSINGNLSGDGNTTHDATPNILGLDPGYNYTITVVCSNETDPADVNNSQQWFLRDPVCGESLATNWTLGHNLTCSGTASGLNISAPDVFLDCNGMTLTGDHEGYGVEISADNASVFNCSITGFWVGIFANNTHGHTFVINTLWNNGFINIASAIALFGVNDTWLVGNAIHDNDEGIYLQGSDNVVIINNNIYNNTNTDWDASPGAPWPSGGLLGLNDAGNNNTNLFVAGNYWGHNSCPLFSYMVDSNILDPFSFDYSPYSAPYGWLTNATLNCSLQANAPVFNNVSFKLPNGSDPAVPITSFSYVSFNGTRVNISEVLPPLGENISENISLWGIYQYYYNPGDDIIFDINITPAHYHITNFIISTDSFINLTNSTWNVANMTGASGAAGTYRINISNYTMSDGNDTPGYGIIDVMLVVTDELGTPRPILLIGLYNFTPQHLDILLGGDTTDWTNISDYTNVTGLTFQIVIDGQNVTKLQFLNPVNLIGEFDFLIALLDLGQYMTASNGSVGLDASMLQPLNKTTNLTFYGVTVSENVTNLTAHLTMDGQPCPPSVCSNFSYDNAMHAFSVVVSHWTNYSIDYTPPTVTAKSPSGTLSRGTTSTTLSATTNEPATCKYSTNDTAYASMADTMGGTGTSHTANVSGLANGGSYSYYVRCADSVNNTMSSSSAISFSVASGGSSGGGGGGGGSSSTPSLSSKPLRATVSSTYGFFKFVGSDSVEHTVRVKSLGNASATLTFESAPVEVKLNVGEEKQVDLTGDRVADIVVNLLNVTATSATFTLRLPTPAAPPPTTAPNVTPNATGNGTANLTAPPPTPPAAPPSTTGQQNGSAPPPAETSARTYAGWILVIIIILIGYFIWWSVKTKRLTFK